MKWINLWIKKNAHYISTVAQWKSKGSLHLEFIPKDGLFH